jgi:hypothetical protein
MRPKRQWRALRTQSLTEDQKEMNPLGSSTDFVDHQGNVWGICFACPFNLNEEKGDVGGTCRR